MSDVTAIGAIGLAGSVLIAVASWWVAARWQSPLDVRVGGPSHRAHTGPPFAVYALGLTLLALAWLVLGHEVLRPGRQISRRALRSIAALWSAPMLVSAPIGSRDLWAYAAQANVAAHGLNPYSHGPIAVPGSFSEQVSGQWLATPSPYGPGWVGLSEIERLVLGPHPWLVVIALRLTCAAGLAALAWAVAALAERAGRREAPPLWATIVNPLFIIDGVGGGHIDLLMAALVCVALVVATSRLELTPAMIIAGGVIGLATSVKLPALIVVPFLGMAWARQRRIRPRLGTQLIATAIALTASAAVCAVLSVGYGFGWLHTAGSNRHSGGPVAAVVIVAAAVIAWERCRRWEPLAMLTVAVVVMLMSVPVAGWWYWIFPIAVAAPLLRRRSTATILGALSIALLLCVRPDGSGLHLRVEMLVSGSLLAAWLVLDRSRPSSWVSAAPAEKS